MQGRGLSAWKDTEAQKLGIVLGTENKQLGECRS
jgi:hypothetical protein